MKTIRIIISALFIVTTLLVTAQSNQSYYFSKTVEDSFEQVTKNLKAALKEQGFGVITEIDMDVKLKEKLPDINMKPYKILGVCNPAIAYKTIQAEENIGVFLPCKAIVKDLGDGKVEVVIVNPSAIMGMLNNAELMNIAKSVSEKFKNALENI